MSEIKQYSRIQHHRLTTSGQVPTIPVVDDVTDSSFLATDVKNGEICINTTDNKIFFRSGSSIVEISTTSIPGTSPWVFDGDDIKTNAVLGSPVVYPKVLPQVDDQIDLGSTSLRWKDLYLGSKIDVSTVLDFYAAGKFQLQIADNEITIGDSTVIRSENAGGTLELDVTGVAGSVGLTTDNGVYSETYLYMDASGGSFFSTGAATLTVKVDSTGLVVKENEAAIGATTFVDIVTGTHLRVTAPTSGIASGDLSESQWSVHVNEGSNLLKFTVKYSDGTTVKTGSIALS